MRKAREKAYEEKENERLKQLPEDNIFNPNFDFDKLPNLQQNAKGNVYNRPTLGLVGEEGRSEVIIPTERIRKGLPVDSSVARELSSIGVPGFARGQTFLSSAQVDAAANTYAMNQQQNALLFAQGSNEAIRRVESNIEKQSADIKKEQRALTNDIMELAIDIETRRVGPRSGSGGGFTDPTTDPPVNF